MNKTKTLPDLAFNLLIQIYLQDKGLTAQEIKIQKKEVMGDDQ